MGGAPYFSQLARGVADLRELGGHHIESPVDVVSALQHMVREAARLTTRTHSSALVYGTVVYGVC